MKNLVLLFSILICFSSCEKETANPVSATDLIQSTAQRSSSNCDKKTAAVQADATDGSTKWWLVFYYDVNGNLIQHPLIDNVNGTVYEYTKVTDSTGAVREFTGGDTLQLFNFGTYRFVECGDVLLPNTEYFEEDTRVNITKSNPVKFETRIDAPIGAGGSTITIIGKGTPLY